MFPLPSPIFKPLSSKMTRQVGAALPVGCGTIPSHGMQAWPQAWHHHTPITPGEVSPLCRVGQGDKSLSIRPTLGRGCPWSLSSICWDGDGRASPCIPLLSPGDIKGLKKWSGSVQVSASHSGQGHQELATWKCRGMVLNAPAGWLPENGCHGKGSELPFWGQSGGTAVQQSSARIAEPCQCSQNTVPVPELVSVLDCHCGAPGWVVSGGSYQKNLLQVYFRARGPAV